MKMFPKKTAKNEERKIIDQRVFGARGCCQINASGKGNRGSRKSKTVLYRIFQGWSEPRGCLLCSLLLTVFPSVFFLFLPRQILQTRKFPNRLGFFSFLPRILTGKENQENSKTRQILLRKVFQTGLLKEQF